MKATSLLLLATACFLIVSCETTGDPNRGGLFQWSEPKAQDRIEAREQRLDDLEAENDYQRRRSANLEARKKQKERELYRERQRGQ